MSDTTTNFAGRRKSSSAGTRSPTPSASVDASLSEAFEDARSEPDPDSAAIESAVLAPDPVEVIRRADDQTNFPELSVSGRHKVDDLRHRRLTRSVSTNPSDLDSDLPADLELPPLETFVGFRLAQFDLQVGLGRLAYHQLFFIRIFFICI